LIIFSQNCDAPSKLPGQRKGEEEILIAQDILMWLNFLKAPFILLFKNI
jgi:hypothetical protein